MTMTNFRTTFRARHRLTSAVQHRGYRVKRPLVPLTHDFDADAVEAIREVAGYTQTTPERIVALRDAVRYVAQAGIPGDIVECGVWRGGSMMVVANELVRRGDTSRRLWLYDTYTGMTPPTVDDVTITGTTGAEWFDAELAKPEKDATGVTGIALETVQDNVASTGYPRDRQTYVVGPVEETLYSEPLPEQIALLRLDTDFFESTRAEMEVLYPRLVPGGILILDDYGYWRGARKAVDDYFATQPALLVRLDNSARLVVKPV
jgi:O-methyltransferase